MIKTAARVEIPQGGRFWPENPGPGGGPGRLPAETTLQGEKIRRKIRKTPCNAPDFLVYYISRLAWAPKMARMRACLDSQRVHRKG